MASDRYNNNSFNASSLLLSLLRPSLPSSLLREMDGAVYYIQPASALHKPPIYSDGNCNSAFIRCMRKQSWTTLNWEGGWWKEGGKRNDWVHLDEKQ